MRNIIYGLILAYIYSYYFLPYNERSQPTINPTIYPIMYKGSIIIPYCNTKAVHLHHWIICLFICLLSVFINIPDIIIGIVLGLFIHGILYKDCFTILRENPYHL